MFTLYDLECIWDSVDMERWTLMDKSKKYKDLTRISKKLERKINFMMFFQEGEKYADNVYKFPKTEK